MAEYIKREAVLRAVQGQRSPCRSPAQNRMLDCLKADVIRISAADVAPVVRCKDCKHHEDEEIRMVYCPNIIGGWVGENWFCADGERKDGGDG